MLQAGTDVEELRQRRCQLQSETQGRALQRCIFIGRDFVLPRHGPSAICGGNGCRSLAPRLVVIAVIAILASLLLPSLAKAKAKAQTVSCLSNLRQLTLCWLMYADDN